MGDTVRNSYTFDENGTMTGAPTLFNVPTMPYWVRWDLYREHVWECPQCAQYAHEKGAPAGLCQTVPCPEGAEMIHDYQATIRMQSMDARWN